MERIAAPSEVEQLRQRNAELTRLLDLAVKSRRVGLNRWRPLAQQALESEKIGKASDLREFDWSQDDQTKLVEAFHRYWYDSVDQTWNNTHWLGHQLLKNPFDLWIYQELLWTVRPTIFIEAGTKYGGSAFYFASLMDLLGVGRVISIDIEHEVEMPVHPRVEYIIGSSADPAVAESIATQIGPEDVVMVFLDSDHTRDHVYGELEVLAPLVTKGSYVIVEDSNINGHPVLPEFGPGPMEALEEWFVDHPEFENDPTQERYLITAAPKGFWRRID